MTFWTSFIPVAILVVCLIMVGALLTIASADASVLRRQNQYHMKEIEDLQMQIKLLQMALGGEKQEEPPRPTVQGQTIPSPSNQYRSIMTQLQQPCTLGGYWVDPNGNRHGVYGAKYRPDGTVEFTDGYILTVKEAQELRHHGWI
jgi:hypothetical protein